MYSPRLLKFSMLLVVAQLFWACGGGGSKSDTTPNAFSFSSQTNVELNTVATSNSITVAGINRQVTVSISGGEYSINGGSFVSGSGTVEQGDTIQLRLTSASTISTSRTATLTIGGVNGTFSVTTISDTTPPQAQVVFPSPVSLTDGNTVTVRGRASDDYGPVTSIDITVTTDAGATTVDTMTLTASGTDDFISTWSAVVELATDSLNTISVLATDEAGNQQETASVVTITQDSSGLETNFPVGNEVYWDEMHIERQIDIDEANNRLVIAPNDNLELEFPQINVMDLDTGVRDLVPPNLTWDSSFAALVDSANNKIYYGGNESIWVLDLTTNEHSVVSDSSSSGSNVDIVNVRNLKLHSNGLLYVIDGTEGIYTVDVVTGARTGLMNLGEDTWQAGLYLDEANNRLLSVDNSWNGGGGELGFVWVGLGDGEVTPLLGGGVFHSGMVAGDLEVDENDARAFFIDFENEELYVLDLLTGNINLVASAEFPAGSANSTIDELVAVAINGADDIGYLVAGRVLNETSWVYFVDLNSGERVLLSRSVRPE